MFGGVRGYVGGEAVEKKYVITNSRFQNICTVTIEHNKAHVRKM